LTPLLAAETESDRWQRTRAEKIATVMQLRSMTRPDGERDREVRREAARAR
jgi:hypothetical protein